jgi:hypothetical protein
MQEGTEWPNQNARNCQAQGRNYRPQGANQGYSSAWTYIGLGSHRFGTCYSQQNECPNRKTNEFHFLLPYLMSFRFFKPLEARGNRGKMSVVNSPVSFPAKSEPAASWLAA